MNKILKSIVVANALLLSAAVSTETNAQALNVSITGGMTNGGVFAGYGIPAEYTLDVVNQGTVTAPAGGLEIEATVPVGMEFRPYTPPVGWTYTIVSNQKVLLTNTADPLGGTGGPIGLSYEEFVIPVHLYFSTAGGATASWSVKTTPAALLAGYSLPQSSGVTYSFMNISIAPVILPVEFSDFTVTAKDCKAVVNWSTASEKNNDHFVIERSTNGTKFTGIGTVKSAGNSNEAKSYSFTDPAPAAIHNFYRVRQVNFDAQSVTTGVKEAMINCQTSNISIYPNPTQSNIVYVKGLTDKSTIEVYNVVGQRVAFKAAENNVEGVNLSGLSSGIYNVNVVSNNEVIFSAKLVKN